MLELNFWPSTAMLWPARRSCWRRRGRPGSRLRAERGGRQRKGENGDGKGDDSAMDFRRSLFPCGDVHSAVFFPQAKVD